MVLLILVRRIRSNFYLPSFVDFCNINNVLSSLGVGGIDTETFVNVSHI